MKLYGDILSGNCYKVKLVCALLNREIVWLHTDILAGETKSSEFKAKSLGGKIPLLELDDGRLLSESNAIVNYLATGSALLPTDPFLLAKVQQWQFFEQYSHEPYIAVARFIAKYLGMPQNRQDEYQAKQQGGHNALAIMEQQLSTSSFLVGEELTTADICLYGYTHVAHEGGFDLSAYSGIQAWLQRIVALPKYVGMAG